MDYIVAQGVTNEAVFEARNVIRKRRTFHISQMKKELDAFMTAVEEAGGHPAGPMVYSLNNVPYDKMLDVEFFCLWRKRILRLKGQFFLLILSSTMLS